MFRVAIVGRPNVGKSTLFNRLCGARKAIVGDEPGITRDIIHATVEWRGRKIDLMDTGGLIPEVREGIPAKVLQQVEKAISKADLLVFVVDGRAGITMPDEQLLPTLRRSGRPFWVVVNKVDTAELDYLAAPFYAFGAEQVLAVSAEHGRGIGELLEAFADRAGDGAVEVDSPEVEEIAVAVVGRPNVGKSSLVNRLLGTERAIVTDVPGTTRDSVDTILNREGTRYRIIDTAGIRRKGRTEERTEKISVVFARKSLERADVAILLLDAEEGVTKLDSTIGGYAAEAGCSVIVAMNKWDLVEKKIGTHEEYLDSVRRKIKHLSYAPVISISALSGQRVSKLFAMVKDAYEGRRVRIPTGVLNNIFVPEVAAQWSASHTSHRPEIRFITQARSTPPTFVVFTTGKELLHFSVERHLVNELRKRFGFYATPIRIRQRLKKPKISEPG